MAKNESMATAAYSEAQQQTGKKTLNRKAALKKEKKGPLKNSDKPEGEAGSEPKQKKGLPPIVLPLFLLLVAVSLAFLVFAAFVYDFQGIKTKIAETFLNEDDYYLSKLEQLDQSIAEYDNKLAQADQIIAENNAVTEALDKRQKKLDKREADLNIRETELNETAKKLESFGVQREQLVTMLASLEPATAAKTIEAMNRTDAARVLSQMEVGRAALILEQMSQVAATEITQIMLMPTE